jgi:hypothetical protein
MISMKDPMSLSDFLEFSAIFLGGLAAVVATAVVLATVLYHAAGFPPFGSPTKVIECHIGDDTVVRCVVNPAS